MKEKVSQWPVQDGRSWLVYRRQLGLTQELVRQGNEIEERGRDQILQCYYLILKICRLPEFLSLETIKCSCSPRILEIRLWPSWPEGCSCWSLHYNDELSKFSAPAIISGIKAGLFHMSQTNAIHCKFSFRHKEAVYNSYLPTGVIVSNSKCTLFSMLPLM